MKQFICFLSGLLFTCFLPAQDSKLPHSGSSVGITAGLNIPIMCYASGNVNKNTSGYARTGFILGFYYSYRFSKAAGIKASWYYGENRAGKGTVHTGLQNNRYRVSGIMAGPELYQALPGNWELAFCPQAGFSQVWTPQLADEGGVILREQSAGCFSWGGQLNLRYHVNEKFLFHLQTGHLNMKPALPDHYLDAKAEQHVVLVTVDAGLGWKF